MIQIKDAARRKEKVYLGRRPCVASRRHWSIQEQMMSNLFEERERGYEAKWAHDEEMHFKIMSLRNARLAHWAAGLMGLPTGELAQYAEAVTAAGVVGNKNDPVFTKIRNDLAARNVKCLDSTIRKKMKELYTQAERELTRR